MKFLGTNFTLEESNVVVFGVPLGKNSLKSLESLRNASNFVEPMDLDFEVNLLENIKTFDLGDIELKSFDKITEQIKKILAMSKIPLMLGGNHLSSFYSLKGFDNTKLIVFDAHGDFKNSWEDEKIRDMNFLEGLDFSPKVNDATWLRHISEVIAPENIMLLGVRSCDEFEFSDLKASGIKFFTSRRMIENLDEVVKSVEEFTKGSDVYISLDADVFDPSVVPDVDMPEPDGIFFNHFQKAVRAIKGNVKGIDVCCLNPRGNNELSEFLIIKSIFEMLRLI